MFTNIKQPVQQFPSSPIVDGSQSASTDFGMFHALQNGSTKDVNNDLDGSDGDEEDDPETERVKAERVIAYNQARDAKTAAKLAAGETLNVAKSIVTLQVKPWDSDSDMGILEKEVRSIEKDGLVWGASKLVPVGYGIMMLQINLVIEDTKVSLTDLEEEISEIEEYVQSTDVIAMQKL